MPDHDEDGTGERDPMIDRTVDASNNRSSAGSSPSNAFSAYSFGSETIRRNLMYIVLVIFSVMLLRNIFFRDYNGEIKDSLIKNGREDLVDSYVPKSDYEKRKDMINEKQQFYDLLKNMTVVMEEQKNLRAEVNQLKQAQKSS